MDTLTIVDEPFVFTQQRPLLPGLCRAAARAIGCAFADAYELDKTSVDALDCFGA